MLNDILVYVLWFEIDDEFPLHNASVVDKHSRLPYL